MLSYDEILYYCSNYKVKNGIVISEYDNKEVLDEDTILKVKTSVLLFREARKEYQSDMKQFGKTNKTKEDYINTTIRRFGADGEKNSFGVNRLVNAILDSNGHYEENMSGKDLEETKFSILVGQKRDYGIAYLRLKFRQKGLDIDNLKVSQDTSELQHSGISKIIIDFDMKKSKNNQQQNQYQHPRANELNMLEEEKQKAKQENDAVAYDYATANIERIVDENLAAVTPEAWDEMGRKERESFLKRKVNEAKALHDREGFDYWTKNLTQLNNATKEETREAELKEMLTSSESKQHLDNNSKK